MALGGCGGSKSSTKSTPAAPEPSKAAESGQTSSQAQGTTPTSKTSESRNAHPHGDTARCTTNDLPTGSMTGQPCGLPIVPPNGGRPHCAAKRQAELSPSHRHYTWRRGGLTAQVVEAACRSARESPGTTTRRLVRISSLPGRVYRAQMVRYAFDDGRRQTNRPSDRTPEEQVESPLRLLRSMTT